MRCAWEGLGEDVETVRGPRVLLDAVRRAAEVEGISVAEWWRRAAQARLDALDPRNQRPGPEKDGPCSVHHQPHPELAASLQVLGPAGSKRVPRLTESGRSSDGLEPLTAQKAGMHCLGRARLPLDGTTRRAGRLGAAKRYGRRSGTVLGEQEAGEGRLRSTALAGEGWSTGGGVGGGRPWTRAQS